MYKKENLTSEDVCKLADAGRLLEIEGGLTWAELLECENPLYTHALLAAIVGRCIKDIRGGVSAAELARVEYEFEYGRQTALHTVAKFAQLEQIRDGVTVSQLAAAWSYTYRTALHVAAFYQQLDKIKGGVTAKELVNVRDKTGDYSALNAAAWGRALHQIKGGVTAEDLESQMGYGGRTALDYAAIQGVLTDITGGIPAAIKNKKKWDNLLCGAILEKRVAGVRACLQMGASATGLEDYLQSLGRLCGQLPALTKDFMWLDWEGKYTFQSRSEVLEHAKELVALTDELGMYELIPVEITAALL